MLDFLGVFGFLLGLRDVRKQRARFSAFVLIIAVLACGISLLISTFVVYLNWAKAREVAGLPRPAPAELRALAPGTRVVIVASLPADAPVSAAGLALFYIERPSASHSTATAAATPAFSSAQWQMETPPPAKMDMVLEDGTILSVQIPQTTSFLNEQTIELGDGGGKPRRHVGYLPRQTLAIDGAWEGNNVLTARAFYAGRVQDYQAFMNNQPGQTFFSGLICGGIGILMLLLGIVLRIFGK